jgi:hypothetical protein
VVGAGDAHRDGGCGRAAVAQRLCEAAACNAAHTPHTTEQQVYQDLCKKHTTFRERSENVDLAVR